MPVMLTTRERAHLKARAHSLEPVVQIGQSGITEQVSAEIDRALTAHELIKVRIGSADREQRKTLGNEVAVKSGAAIVHRVGKIVILWRPRPQDTDR